MEKVKNMLGLKDVDVSSHDGKKKATEDMEIMYRFIRSRMYLISSFIGDRQQKKTRRRGTVGLCIWITNMCIHFAIDFYEAAYVFHLSWLSCQVIWLVVFLILSVFLAKKPIRWFIHFTKKLSGDYVYHATMSRLHLLFRCLPYIMVATATTGAVCQYLCYWYDDALQIHIGTGARVNGTSDKNAAEVLEYVSVGLNIIRFTSLFHIYYVMFLTLFMIVVIFYGLFKSQRDFNNYIGNALSTYPPILTFAEAIEKFDRRSKYLSDASASSTIVLTSLVLATSVSFVVNAYNFLFMKKFAIYVWFAVAPLIWNITPLVCAAFVTSSYKDLKIIVMESWVQIPDEYDEVWIHENQKPAKETQKNEVSAMRAKLDEISKGSSSQKSASNQNQPSKTQIESVAFKTLTNPSVSNDNEAKGKILKDEASSMMHLSKDGECTVEIEVTSDSLCCERSPFLTITGTDGSLDQKIYLDDKIEKTTDENTQKTSESDSLCNRKDVSRFIKTDLTEGNLNPGNDESTENKVQVKEISAEDKKSEKDATPLLKRVRKLSKFRAAALSVAAAQKMGKKRSIKKFNYEKYLRVLEHTLEHTGFSIGKVVITWDRVSFIMVLLFTLVGVFAQNIIL